MSESSTPSSTPLLSDGVYSKLKHTASIVLPAVAALYIALSNLWGWPNTEEVAGSIAALNTAIGALVALSTKSYNKSDAKYAGTLVRTETADKIQYSLELNQDAPRLDEADEVTFKVSDTGTNPIVTP